MTIEKWPDSLPRAGNQQFNQLESISKWFEIYQINPETFALLEPHHDEEVTPQTNSDSEFYQFDFFNLRLPLTQ